LQLRNEWDVMAIILIGVAVWIISFAYQIARN
jgi:hypothetical protein